MPRVDYYKDEQLHLKLPITFNPRANVFQCAYAGQTYQHANLVDLKKTLDETIKASLGLRWIPVIEVTIPAAGRRYREVCLALHAERKYIGHLASRNEYRQVHWTCEENHRLASSYNFLWDPDKPFTLPTTSESRDSSTIYLPYSETTWTQVEEIAQYIQLAAQKLRETLRSETSVEQVLQICHLLFDHYATRHDTASEEE